MLNRASLLLPPNRSALESAVVDALHTLEHPERLLSTLYNPDAVAAPQLPWLAWGRDVLAWPSDADETQRRQLTARSWHLHRRMGTLSGLRELAAVFGGTITKAITPPAKLYAAPALTVAERNAFVARYPQLRIYRHRVEGVRQGAMLQGEFLGAAFPAVSDAVGGGPRLVWHCCFHCAPWSALFLPAPTPQAFPTRPFLPARQGLRPRAVCLR